METQGTKATQGNTDKHGLIASAHHDGQTGLSGPPNSRVHGIEENWK